MDLALGVDIGTGTTKAAIADAGGQVLWNASRSYGYSSPAQGDAEQDPLDWWNAARDAIRTLFQAHPEAPGCIRAVGVSGQGVAAALVDHAGLPIRPAMLWLDQRSAQIAEDLQCRMADRVAGISGKAPASYNVEPKLLWLQRNEPKHWARTWKFFTATSYITYRLSGQPVMNHSDGGILLGYDLRRRAWSQELIDAMGLPSCIYPSLAESHSVIGAITEEAACETGLRAGTPVVAGGEDTSSAGLAMGALLQSDGQLSLGSANTIYFPHHLPLCHPRLLSFPHVLPDLILIGGSIAAGGLSTQWLGKILSGQDGLVNAELLNQLTIDARQVAPGSDGLVFLPYIAGEMQPINDGFARGVFFGLTSAMGRAHLLRAVLEANAFAIRHNLEIANSVGAAPRRLLAVGGPTRNQLLCQIIADISGLPVEVMDESRGAAFGSAMLAAKGANMIDDYAGMQKAHAKRIAVYQPDFSGMAAYNSAFQTYLELYPRLADLFPRERHQINSAVRR